MSEDTNVRRFKTADEIDQVNDTKYREEYIPEWETWIRLKTLSAYDAVQFSLAMKDKDKSNWALINMFAKSVVDEKGELMYPGDRAKQLHKKNNRIFVRLQPVFMEMNGFNEPTKTIDTVLKFVQDAGIPEDKLEDIVVKIRRAWQSDDAQVAEERKND